MRVVCMRELTQKLNPLPCPRTYYRKVHQNRPQNGVSYLYGMAEESLVPLTIPDVIRAAAAEVPDRAFIVSQHQDISRSFAQLNQDANRLAHGLQKLGVKRGDRVGLWSPNSYEWVVTQFGTAKVGAVLVNVNPGYREKEFMYCANLVKCHTLIFAQKFKSSNYCDILNNVSPGILAEKDGLNLQSKSLPDLRNLICLPAFDGQADSAAANITRFSDILSSSSQQEFTDQTITFDDAINIQFTSGTTGSPKGATLSHHNIVNNALYFGKRMLGQLKRHSDICICVPNPLYHCMGSVNGTLAAAMFRSTVVLPAPTAQAPETLKAIHRFKANIVYGTPTMFVDLLAQPRKGLDLSSLERALMSGSPCPIETIQRVKNELFPACSLVSIPYGSTETSPVITMPKPDVPEKYAYDTVGLPLDHTEIKIADPVTGAALPIGQSGEVMSRGFHTFIGYWNQAEKTAEVLDDRRWYHTGDIGVMNEEGYVSIIGRIKDMIIRGGENIYPREIEDFLLTHESVQDVNVVGVPDHRMGEEVCAFVILKPGVVGPEAEVKEQLVTYCKANIAHFKIPKHVVFVQDFPRTVTMKVQKHKLREMAIQLTPRPT